MVKGMMKVWIFWNFAKLDLMIANSIFAKPTDKLVTFKSGDSKSQIDYILTRREHISKIKACFNHAGK